MNIGTTILKGAYIIISRLAKFVNKFTKSDRELLYVR